MVVMSAGTPITIQNSQIIQQTANNHAEKQQQQLQLQQQIIMFCNFKFINIVNIYKYIYIKYIKLI